MKAKLQFEVLDWTDDHIYILKIRVYGTNQRGETVDEPVVFREPVEPSKIHTLLAKMNNSNYR